MYVACCHNRIILVNLISVRIFRSRHRPININVLTRNILSSHYLSWKIPLIFHEQHQIEFHPKNLDIILLTIYISLLEINMYSPPLNIVKRYTRVFFAVIIDFFCFPDTRLEKSTVLEKETSIFPNYLYVDSSKP